MTKEETQEAIELLAAMVDEVRSIALIAVPLTDTSYLDFLSKRLFNLISQNP